MPIPIRKWWVERITKELNKQSPSGEEAPNRALHANTPEMRQMQGRTRAAVPSRLRRFS